MQRKYFLFLHPGLKIFPYPILTIYHDYLRLCKYFSISLHKLWGCVLPLVYYVTNGDATDEGPGMDTNWGPTSASAMYFFMNHTDGLDIKAYICLEVHPCYGSGVLLVV